MPCCLINLVPIDTGHLSNRKKFCLGVFPDSRFKHTDGQIPKLIGCFNNAKKQTT